MEQAATRLEVLGRKIHEIRGGSGRPVLYLHSALGEVVWMPHLVRLAERYELHVPAHPGFRGSEGIDQIRDIEDLVNHYLAYLDVMGWKTIDVIGLSLGGWIAAEMAARYPERVTKLVLVDAVGIWIKEKPLLDIFRVDLRFPERIKAMLFHDPSGPAAQMIPSIGDFSLPDEVLLEMFSSLAATAKIGWNPLMHDPRLEGLLPRVKAKTLCLWGASDRIAPVDYGEKFARLIPGARLEVVAEAGHLLPLEKSREFHETVCGFLG